ncbi:MmgE/PrpD family protein [Hydrogenophaga sp. BPS33]|uniref:MmgE/PrpD family protein n=1 Tax=Hydrogenophaga sp. BPS33 TaxID=2651974 RepID=UPI00131F9D30|nr:MmgE/PrpD family protein [Hydrogenophaga sp. BPS33]QHE84694.1 MmgE/PrpD family protein [Hydrogenophaga sp. BPS33]
MNQSEQFSPTEALATFGANLRFEDLPTGVVSRMKMSLLDSLGCCIHGATLPWSRIVADMCLREDSKPVATILGQARRSSAALAALANATAGHAFELDDIHKESVVHAGSIALPVTLAMAEEQQAMSGADFLTAMVAGYEVGHRVGSAATTSLFFRGFHPQGTSGVFVAAASAARALGLPAHQFQHALGIVGSQAGGLMAAQEGAMVKRFHSGRAAQSGVYAAFLAKESFTGVLDVLEASYGGYLTSYSDEPNVARLLSGLGETWETLSVGYKPHASVTSIHTALDCLDELMKEHAFDADAIDQMQVGLSRMTHVHCAWPYKAQGVTAAQMNLFYGLAVIAIDREAFTEQYAQERLADERILSFIEKITATIDPEIDAEGAAARHACRLHVQLNDGRAFERFKADRHGSPTNPLTEAEIVRKFERVVAKCVPEAGSRRIVDVVSDIERLPTIVPLIDALRFC